MKSHNEKHPQQVNRIHAQARVYRSGRSGALLYFFTIYLLFFWNSVVGYFWNILSLKVNNCRIKKKKKKQQTMTTASNYVAKKKKKEKATLPSTAVALQFGRVTSDGWREEVLLCKWLKCALRCFFSEAGVWSSMGIEAHLLSAALSRSPVIRGLG